MQSKMAAAPLYEVVSVRFERATVDRLREAARRSDRSLNAEIRRIIRHWLDEQGR